jgi:pSer/pThr/pTyr-binding forkhead associated (FHA) protein
MHLTLKLIDDEVIKKTIHSDVITIGRSKKCSLPLSAEGISRNHLKIELINGEIFITDLGSTNGVLINDKKINPHQKVQYQNFLTLSFGSVQSLHIETETNINDKISFDFEKMNSTQTSSKTSITKFQKTSEASVPNPQTVTDAKGFRTKLEFWKINFIIAMIFLVIYTWYMYDNPETGTQEDLEQEDLN